MGKETVNRCLLLLFLPLFRLIYHVSVVRTRLCFASHLLSYEVSRSVTAARICRLGSITTTMC